MRRLRGPKEPGCPWPGTGSPQGAQPRTGRVGPAYLVQANKGLCQVLAPLFCWPTDFHCAEPLPGGRLTHGEGEPGLGGTLSGRVQESGTHLVGPAPYTYICNRGRFL